MQTIQFVSDNLTLVGTFFPPKENRTLGVLMIHGASTGKYHYAPLQEFLYRKGISSFAYDTRGMGESEGAYKDSSLENRVRDASAAYKEYTKYVDNIIVVGVSMGGYVAIALTHLHPAVKGLVLIGPAAYTMAAEHVALGQVFTQRISQKDSWEDSASFTYLRQYPGFVLTLYGEHDTVIPPEIQERYQACLTKKDTFVRLAGADHSFLAEQHKKSFSTGLQYVADFIQRIQSEIV